MLNFPIALLAGGHPFIRHPIELRECGGNEMPGRPDATRKEISLNVAFCIISADR